MRAIAVGLVVAAVAVAVFWEGGFDASPQWTFAGIAAAAGLVALAAARARAWSAPVVVLLAMAALQALSAAWAIVPPADSLRAAALTLGYAALVIAGATQPAQRIAALIAVAAGVTGLMGIVSAALYSRTFAERIEGGWRPEGPFGYPPALALVQVFALPALLTAMVRARPALAGVAAAGVVIASGALILVANRLTLAFAVVVLGIALALARRRAAPDACACDLRRRRDRLPRAAGRLDVALCDRWAGRRPRGRRGDRGPGAPLGARAQAARRDRAEPRPPSEACARRRRGSRSRRRAGRAVQRRRAERPAVRVAPGLHARADVDVERLLPHRGQTAPPGLRGRLLLRSDREPPAGPRARHALRARLSARAVGRDGDRGPAARARPLRRRRPRPVACARLTRSVAPRAGRRRVPAREPRRLAVAPGRCRGARALALGGLGGLTPARARRL